MHTKTAHVSHYCLSRVRAREYLRQRNRPSRARATRATHRALSTHKHIPRGRTIKVRRTSAPCALSTQHTPLCVSQHSNTRAIVIIINIIIIIIIALFPHVAHDAPGNQLSDAAPRVVVFTLGAARARGATVVAKTRACANMMRVREWRRRRRPRRRPRRT
jgi:hypothetical protein